MIELPWANLKSVISSKGLALQWYDYDSIYHLYAIDGPLIFSCKLHQNAADPTDLNEFVASYKSAANSTAAQVVLPTSFSAKTVVVSGTLKRLYARNTGIQATVSPGSNTINYTATYAWAKVIGMECINALPGDYASMQVYDNHAGTYSGVPDALLNQFGYSLNMGPDYYKRESPFDADLYAGMVMKITYFSVTPILTTRTIGINILMNELKT